ncbi:hypothetical protein D9756_009470 [Leucocoprinus leucothites]|uniref:F-box domain-containing protein n=1 Tax=Leucocoprinus leucothites TaxID=201217 RepID=A0A8H5FU80_9AGAR|nr:hypothetical protein D9756_009470 [Leucoagaricus leucothites]
MTYELEDKPKLPTFLKKCSPQERVKHLDLLIRRLSIERSHYLSTINTENSYTRSLPTEVLMHIFKCAAPPIEFERPKLSKWDEDPYDNSSPWSGPQKYARIRFVQKLAAVSALWHSAVYSTPELWTSVAIKLSPRKMEAKLSLLNIVFQNCGSLGVDLKLKFKHFPRYHHYDPVPKGLLHLLQTHTSRLKALRLEDPPSGLCRQFEGRYTNLECLDVSWSPATAPIFSTINAESAPALRKLSLKSVNNLVLQWSAITSLNLTEVSVDICALILLNGWSPNLTEFFCRSPAPPHRHMPDLTIPVKPSFPQMRDFGWQCLSDYTPWNNLIFQNVQLPSLRTLYWPGGRPDQEAPFNYPSFFGHFSSTLTRLYLEKPSAMEEILFCLFGQEVNPSTLIVEDCDHNSLKAIWQLLDPEHRTVGEHRQMLLPKLQEVLLVYTPGYERPSTLTNGVSSAMLNMLVNRRNKCPEKELRVNAVNHVGFPWDGDSAERMYDLVRSGFPLEIYEFGELHPTCDPSSHES